MKVGSKVYLDGGSHHGKIVSINKRKQMARIIWPAHEDKKISDMLNRWHPVISVHSLRRLTTLPPKR